MQTEPLGKVSVGPDFLQGELLLMETETTSAIWEISPFLGSEAIASL